MNTYTYEQLEAVERATEQRIRQQAITENVTKAAGFDRSPAVGMDLFSVNAGFDADLAKLQAGALEAGVRELLQDGIANSGAMDGDVLNLCLFALEAAGAIRSATD